MTDPGIERSGRPLAMAATGYLCVGASAGSGEGRVLS